MPAGDPMTALVVVATVCALLILAGALIGAELQDRLHEAHRRRMAVRQLELRRELDKAWSRLERPALFRP